ncbi:DUF3040 domain-containing protein [Corynebacterium mayonis]|uniref:DUF3040 domain-containing protein n=1 Tax=Corynebacterium mayonis TaxID=3062461 RepID=UPI0031408131
MSLSEQEQRALREIEQSLLAEDPSFARSMPHTNGPSLGGGLGKITMRSVALVVFGLALLIGGVALATVSTWLIAISIIGFAVMFAGGVMALRTPNAGAASRASASATPRASARSSKMEENFRRRFEGQ